MSAGPDDDLRAQAEAFAERVTRSVRVVAPGCAPFAATALSRSGQDLFAVRQSPDTGVELTVADDPLLTITVRFHCSWDSARRFLAVSESHFKLYAGQEAAGEPILRYHYLRQAADDMPAAHIHVHAHRDAMSHALAKSGTRTDRAKRRARSSKVPRMEEVHFPVGGTRFRPCLEDLLEMLIGELGVDHTKGARDVLRAERAHWRRQQVGAATRDAPEHAAQVLEQLGYVITRPAVIPGENTRHLEEL